MIVTIMSRPWRHRLLFALLFAVLLFPGVTSRAQEWDRPRSPRFCGRCHEEAYAEWIDSGHNLQAFHSEQFQAVWERQRQSVDCLTCHATLYDAGDEVTVTYEGVTCQACHKLIGTDYDPDVRDHATMSIPETTQYCAECHGNDHAVTFGEWQTSAHNGAREVNCMACHDSHTGGLMQADLTALCGSCHMQPVPEVSAHMHVDSGCTDCHPAPINMDNVHLGGEAPVADCVDCHMPVIMEQYGRYPASTGHAFTVSLAACGSCHGGLHTPLDPTSQAVAQGQ